MGTYKVIQDIEAEDRLLGPLTLRQFIYAIIVVVSLFVCFKLYTAPGAAKFFIVLLIPHTIFFAVLAAPFGHDQSNEVWLLAKIRFFFKPRKRIWDQTGIKDLVTITVPKKIERQLTKGYSQTEIKSRLSALANTIDSRGWAVKNVNTNLFQQPSFSYVPDSDRLVSVSDMPREVPIEEISSSYDILDEWSSPTAQNMGSLIQSSEQLHHQQLTAMMQQSAQQTTAGPINDSTQWFATTNPSTNQPQTVPIAATNTINDFQASQPQVASPVTPVRDPAIINLATNDDLNIATIAREADKVVEQHSDEVVISLR